MMFVLLLCWSVTNLSLLLLRHSFDLRYDYGKITDEYSFPPVCSKIEAENSVKGRLHMKVRGHKNNENSKDGSYVGVGIAIGVALGAALKNIPIGIALGVAVGSAMDGSKNRGIRKKK